MSKPSLTSQIIAAAEALDDHVQDLLQRTAGRPPFTTTTGVIEALGGPSAVAKLTGAKLTAIANWQSFHRFPARFYVIMLTALHERGLHAPARLWGMETGHPRLEPQDEEDKIEAA